MRNTLCRVVIAVMACVPLFGQADKPTEYQVKAVYLYNFARLGSWPNRPGASVSGTFAVCVLGQDPFGPHLDAAVAGETIFNAHVIVQRISKPKEAVTCRVLFISSSQDNDLKEILAGL